MFANFWMNCIGRESLIAADDTWGLLAVLCVGVFISIWLEQRYQWASKISGAIVALLIAMVLANLTICGDGSSVTRSVPLYQGASLCTKESPSVPKTILLYKIEQDLITIMLTDAHGGN